MRNLHQMKTETQLAFGRMEELRLRLGLLENHEKALEYAAGEENNRRIAAAQAAAEEAARVEEQLCAQCATLPDGHTAQEKMERLQLLQQHQHDARMEAQMLPQPPSMPNDPYFSYGVSGAKVLDQVHTDIADYRGCVAVEKMPLTLLIFGAAAAMLGALLMILKLLIPGAMVLAAGIAVLILHSIRSGKQKAAALSRIAKAEAIRARYGGGDPDDWLANARAYDRSWTEYESRLSQYQQSRQQLEHRLAQLDAAVNDATAGQSMLAAMEYWKKVSALNERHREAKKELQRAMSYAEDLSAMAKPVEKPEFEDVLTYSPVETRRMMEENRLEQQRLQQSVDQLRGRMDALGEEAVLRRQLEQVNGRIGRLTETYAALELAQETLAAATAQLQRRFAPRITSEAQNILHRMTGGRYDRLTLSQDMSLSAATGEETVLRAAQRRSEGTVDQIYLALRLAVSKELTPDTPLVLDDALVRFDDVRHAAAMEILKEEALDRQIILFTCQSRETQ